MSHDIQIVDPCTSEEWREFVHEHPDAGVFHHPAWLQMLRDVYGYRIFAACIKDGRRIRAGMPFADVRSLLTGKRWISVPFSDHCRPLLSDEDPASMDALISFLKQSLSSETPRIEIRWRIAPSPNVFSECNFVNHVLHLGKDPETLFRSFDKHTQRAIKIPQKGGIVVRTCKSYEEYEEYFRLQVMTRKRLGVPAQPKDFFKGVWKYILNPGMGFVLMAYKGSTPLAGGVFFTFNKTITYKYSASDRDYQALRPNHAFILHAIQRANAEGYARIDFGRSEIKNEGLKRFKRGWGATEEDLPYTIIAKEQPKRGSSRLDSLVGVVIRGSPEFVCTLSGKLLYRHFA